jgi:hypothetical protein
MCGDNSDVALEPIQKLIEWDESFAIPRWALICEKERAMWKPEHRQAGRRKGRRYDSDLSDAEWALIAPMIPPARRGGRPRDVNVREVLNGIFYVLWTVCQWKALPKTFRRKAPCITIWSYGSARAAAGGMLSDECPDDSGAKRCTRRGISIS